MGTNDEGQPQYLNDKASQHESGERRGLQQDDGRQHDQPSGREEEKAGESHENLDYYNNLAFFTVARFISARGTMRLISDTTTSDDDDPLRRLADALLTGGLAIFAEAQNADTILINGKILTADPQFSIQQAIAVRDGKIDAVGTNAEIRKAAGPKARVIDLGGRTVIPGLIDSHMHAIRAASFFSTEVNWAGVPSLAEALDRI